MSASASAATARRLMKAIAVFPGQRDLQLVQHPEPELTGPTDVKIRMIEAGICGTDREIVSGQYGTPPGGGDYLIIGHESLGRVIEAGDAVTRVRPGDLVVPMVRRPCPHSHCLACRAGRSDFCYTGDFTERGIKQRHGFMTEFVVDDEEYMSAVPESIRGIAVLAEPLTIAEKALEQIWQVQSRLPWACPVVPGKAGAHCHTAVVLGAGPVGMLGALAFAAAGFRTVVYSRTPAPNDRSALCDLFGAEYVSSETTPPAGLSGAVGAIDVVFEATGASRFAFEVMKHIGANAVFVLTGVPGRRAPAEIDTDLLMRNLVLSNQVVFGTVNAGRQSYEAAIRDLATFQSRWPEAVSRLISGRYPMECHRDHLCGEATGIKNVITLGGE